MAVFSTPPVPRELHHSLWRSIDWTPTDIQREILLDPTRNKVVALGRRAGKSQTGGHRLIPEVFRAWYELNDLERKSQRREYWIVGPEYSDSEKEFRVAWEQLERLDIPFDHPGSYNNPEGGDMSISMFDRRFLIHAKSSKYPGTLVGEGLSGVIMAEAAKMKPSIWHKFIRPMLADFEGWSMFNSTPEGKNWFYDLYMTGLDEDRPDWKSWRAPSWCNPYVYPGGVDEAFLDKAIEMRRKHQLDRLLLLYKAIQGNRTVEFWKDNDRSNRTMHGRVNAEIWAMFLDMSQEMFNQEVAALFTEYVGRVFKDFDEEFHVVKQEYEATWTTYACVDYGFTNPFVWLVVQIDPARERVHVVDEYYEIHKTTEEAAAEIAARGLAPRTIRTFYPDPAEPDRTRTLSRRLQLKPHGGASIELEDRLEWIRRGLKVMHQHLPYGHPEHAPALTIHPRCVNLIREMNDYKYPETREKAGERGRAAREKPENKNDHAPEALGRFYSGLFGKPWNDGEGARQTRAQVGRRR
jgi:hypothetical protein